MFSPFWLLVEKDTEKPTNVPFFYIFQIFYDHQHMNLKSYTLFKCTVKCHNNHTPSFQPANHHLVLFLKTLLTFTVKTLFHHTLCSIFFKKDL